MKKRDGSLVSFHMKQENRPFFSNVSVTDGGITVKNVISDELSNEIVKDLQKNKK